MTDRPNHDRVEVIGNDGLEFAVTDAGPLDGEPIVLLHGFPERSTSWREVTPRLNAAGYRTLAMDQRGYSPRARPTRRRDYRLPLLVGDVVALIDEVAEPQGRAHVVGHDWGAMAGWMTALLEPTRVSTLTAISVPHPQAFLTSMVRSRQLLSSWYMGLFQVPWLPETMARRGLMDGGLRSSGMRADDIARFHAEIVETGALPTALNWYRALPLSDLRLSRGKVQVPTTMVWSSGDVAIGRWSAEHTLRWVDADYTYVELPDVSHWIPAQAPEACAEAILARVAGSAP